MPYTIYGARAQFLSPEDGADFYYEVTEEEGGQHTIDLWVESTVPDGTEEMAKFPGRVWRPTILNEETQRYVMHGDWVPKNSITIQLYTRLNTQHRPGRPDRQNGDPIILTSGAQADPPGKSRYRR